uniref:Uncharacterized protein n=1 Tax=Timema douglasi TaxID=61478 RepID=A0A7R8VZW2_TIMDO|nr:unnamed protein product [Timema douglasi]
MCFFPGAKVPSVEKVLETPGLAFGAMYYIVSVQLATRVHLHAPFHYPPTPRKYHVLGEQIFTTHNKYVLFHGPPPDIVEQNKIRTVFQHSVVTDHRCETAVGETHHLPAYAFSSKETVIGRYCAREDCGRMDTGCMNGYKEGVCCPEIIKPGAFEPSTLTGGF